MNGVADPALAVFQAQRPRLLGLAYRMLGSPADAEDVLQDAWLRWQAQPLQQIEDPAAWLVTTTTRLALDRLRQLKREREHYIGPWLPEPLAEVEGEAQAQGEDAAAVFQRAQSLNLSFLLLLERLSPEERAAFLLHEVFDYSHEEGAAMLQISVEAARQRVHRARGRLREGRTRFLPGREQQRQLLQRFAEAMARPTAEALRALLNEDARHVSDGGGVVFAALRPLQGAERLVRLYLQIARHTPPDTVWQVQELHRQPVLLCWKQGRLDSLSWVEEVGGRIGTIHALRHPAKLARIAVTFVPPASSLG